MATKKKSKMELKMEELAIQGMSARGIAKEAGVSNTTVSNYLRKLGLTNTSSYKLTTQEIVDRMREKYPTFEYIGGYINGNSKMIVRCKMCGYEFEYTAINLRPSRNVKMQCDKCNEAGREISRARNALIDILGKYIKAVNKECDIKVREETESLTRIARKHKHHIECEECGRKFFTNRNNSKACSIKCVNKRNNRIKEIRRREAIKDNGRIDWDITLDKIIARDGNTCHICGNVCDKEDFEIDGLGNFIVKANYPSIDHVIAVSNGGTHTWDNVKLAHHYCNSVKNDKQVYERGDGQLIMAL